MSPRTPGLSEVVSEYLMQVGLREPDVLRSVRICKPVRGAPILKPRHHYAAPGREAIPCG